MITFEIDELTPCLKGTETGELVQEVNRYVDEVGLYEEKEPLRFNLRAYARYMQEHDLTNPDDVPQEVMDSFWKSKEQAAV